MNEIFKLFGSIGIHTDEAENGLDNISKKGESTAGGLPSIFGKAALAIGGIFAAGKIIDFGKDAVNAAADADAIRSQFTQVFGDLTGEADQTASELASQFGMIPEQLQPGMVKFESMFKGVGISSKDALTMTKDATTAAADAAAFANVSYDEAQGSLQSFILGNYEAGDAIGIQANDNAIAQYAIQQGAAKSTAEWQKMGDAQKEQMRLGYVKHVQELSGVTGQANRESGSFAVQMDKLKATWDKFLAVVGAPVLAAVLPILSGMGNALMGLVGWVQKILPNMNQAQGGVSNFVNEIKAFFIPIVQNMMPVIRDVFGTISNVIRTVFGAVVAWLRPTMEGLAKFWKENGESIQQAIVIAFNIIKNIIMTVMPFVVNIIKSAWDMITGIIDGAIRVIEGIIQVFSGILTGDWSKVWEGIKNIVGGAWDAIGSFVSNGVNIVKNIIGGWASYMRQIFSEVGQVIGRLVDNAFGGIGRTIRNTIDSAVNVVRNGIGWIKDLFNFNIKFPHIPLPHFRVRGSANPLDWLEDGVPSIGIDWYAKGGIMKSATPFGMNGNNMMVGGEAGDEAVLPLNRENLGMIGERIAQSWNANQDNAGMIEAIAEMTENIVKAVLANKDTYIDGNKLTAYVENGIIKGAGF